MRAMAASNDDEVVVEEVEVVVGTYEEFVVGYKLGMSENYNLTMSFTNHSQSKSIRAVTAIGKFIAAGSADETINLINMAARVEHGSLSQQAGTITCLTEFNGNYLFSGCDDGTICIWKKGSWICEKTLKAHAGGVTDISVHPSGKLALSVGKDKALKTWNLVKGRCGYVTNLKAIAEAVRWSPEGEYYAVSLPNRVDVYSLETAKVVYSTPVAKRISCLSFLNNHTLVIAGDSETVEVHDINATNKTTEFKAHKVRVKAVQFVPELEMLFTASNDGFIKVWKFSKGASKPPKLVTEIDTTCRITCMTVWTKVTGSATEDVTEEMEVEEEEDTVDAGEDNNDGDSDSSEQEDQDDQVDDSSSDDDVKMSVKRRKVDKSPKIRPNRASLKQRKKAKSKQKA